MAEGVLGGHLYEKNSFFFSNISSVKFLFYYYSIFLTLQFLFSYFLKVTLHLKPCQFAGATHTEVSESDDDDDQSSGREQISRCPLAALSTTSSFGASTSSQVVTVPLTTSDLREAVLQMLSKADEGLERRRLTGHLKMVHDFATLLEDHMQTIPEDLWHSFQIDCLNLVQSYKQRGQQHKHCAL